MPPPMALVSEAELPNRIIVAGVFEEPKHFQQVRGDFREVTHGDAHADCLFLPLLWVHKCIPLQVGERCIRCIDARPFLPSGFPRCLSLVPPHAPPPRRAHTPPSPPPPQP